MPNWGKLREPRQGVMLHYDGSASDAGAVAWLTRDPNARVSYNFLILDDGQVVTVAPVDARAWHAGVCQPAMPELMPYTDANSAFYGVALAAKPGDVVSAVQYDALVATIRRLVHAEGWGVTEIWRITDHAREAWPRGRKVDLGRTLRDAQGDPVTLERVRRDAMGIL